MSALYVVYLQGIGRQNNIAVRSDEADAIAVAMQQCVSHPYNLDGYHEVWVERLEAPDMCVDIGCATRHPESWKPRRATVSTEPRWVPCPPPTQGT